MPELTGRVLYPGDPGWDDARRGFAIWADFDANQPKVIVFCQCAADASNAVRWATANSIPIRIRCGRHNYQGYSSLAKDGIIIDVSEMDSVQVNRNSLVATVGAGLDMLQFYEALGESGFAVPGATGPSVGLAGLTLGSGFGPTSRKWGLTCDHLVDVEIVNANGDIIHANEQTNPDLFWACKGGGGGNFGVVTAFTFKVNPVGNVAVFSLGWEYDQLYPVAEAWMNWAPVVEDSMTASLMMLANNPKNAAMLTSSARPITLYGQFTPDSDQDLASLSTVLGPMLATGPTSVQIQVLPYLIATRVLLGVDPTSPTWRLITHSDTEVFKSTSSFAYELFDADVLKIVKKHLDDVPTLSGPPTEPSMIQFLPGGGLPSRIDPQATAAYPRKAKFVVQYNAYWNAPEDGAKNIAWIEGFRNALLPYTKGAYVNYNDSTLTNYLEDYYGPNLPRLVAVKKQYDPNNVFNFQQSIPTSL